MCFFSAFLCACDHSSFSCAAIRDEKHQRASSRPEALLGAAEGGEDLNGAGKGGKLPLDPGGRGPGV